MKEKESIIKDIEHELFEQTDLIEDVLIKLKKADTILEHWIKEYSFNQEPDPSLIYKNDAEKEILKKQAKRWYWEYNFIYQFIAIVRDYVYDSQELLEQAIKVKEDNGIKEAV